MQAMNMATKTPTDLPMKAMNMPTKIDVYEMNMPTSMPERGVNL